MPRQNLGELEQLILFALVRLGDDAYGAAIRAEILERTGRSVTPGALYPALDRMEERRLLKSRMGEPTAERGGRAPRHFALTADGLAEIRRSWKQTLALAGDIQDVLGGKGRRK